MLSCCTCQSRYQILLQRIFLLTLQQSVLFNHAASLRCPTKSAQAKKRETESGGERGGEGDCRQELAFLSFLPQLVSEARCCLNHLQFIGYRSQKTSPAENLQAYKQLHFAVQTEPGPHQADNLPPADAPRKLRKLFQGLSSFIRKVCSTSDYRNVSAIHLTL